MWLFVGIALIVGLFVIPFPREETPKPATETTPGVATPLQEKTTAVTAETQNIEKPNTSLPATSSTETGCGPGLGGSKNATPTEYALLSKMADSSGINPRQNLVKNLLASTNSKTRAAGLFLDATSVFPEVLSCSGDECLNAEKKHNQEKSASIAQLATLARDSSSAEIYAWADAACNLAATKSTAPAACTSLSAERWAQLAPDSAWPWLLSASEAKQRGDLSGQETAMFRASLARDWTSSSGTLLSLMASNLPVEVQGLPRLQVLGVEGSNATGLLSLPAMGASAYCSSDQDANKRQLCAQLADHMLSSADNLLQLSLGIRIGERSGLPEAQLAAAREDRDKLTTATQTINSIEFADMSKNCNGLTNQLRHLQRRVEIGELAALREHLRSK